MIMVKRGSRQKRIHLNEHRSMTSTRCGYCNPELMTESQKKREQKANPVAQPVTGSEALRFARLHRYSFLTARDLELITTDEATRLEPVLIRFHEGRLTCPAQDAAKIMGILSTGGWTLRDVSLPARRLS